MNLLLKNRPKHSFCDFGYEGGPLQELLNQSVEVGPSTGHCASRPSRRKSVESMIFSGAEKILPPDDYRTCL